jgi:hypothetical protein
MTDHECQKVAEAYLHRFGIPMPCPACVNFTYGAEVATSYMAKGRQIPRSYNWWAHVPPDALP